MRFDTPAARQPVECSWGIRILTAGGVAILPVWACYEPGLPSAPIMDLVETPCYG